MGMGTWEVGKTFFLLMILKSNSVSLQLSNMKLFMISACGLQAIPFSFHL